MQGADAMSPSVCHSPRDAIHSATAEEKRSPPRCRPRRQASRGLRISPCPSRSRSPSTTSSCLDGTGSGPKPAPGDFADPDADPMLARSRRQRPDWPEPYTARWRTSRLRKVMGDALRNDAPSDASVRIPTVDLEAGWCARREIQLRSGGSPKGNHALVEEVVDRKDDRPYLVIHEGYPTDVARSETFDALQIGHSLKLARPGTEVRPAHLHHCTAGMPLESSHR